MCFYTNPLRITPQMINTENDQQEALQDAADYKENSDWLQSKLFSFATNKKNK